MTDQPIEISRITRRDTMATAAQGDSVGGGMATDAVRPFRMRFPDADLAELRRRVQATRWPERETVADASQGVQLTTIQALARYWASDYDWRQVEARLNALPQFITEIEIEAHV